MINHLTEKQLNNLLQLLDNIEERQYSARLDDVFKSSIGKHTRHIIEFYQLFFQAYQSSFLSYDERQRNIQLETHKFVAINEIQSILNNLTQITENKSLMLQTTINETEYEIPTTVFRELHYLLEHTTHHLALMRMGIQNLSENISVPKDFGYAYSTLNNEK